MFIVLCSGSMFIKYSYFSSICYELSTFSAKADTVDEASFVLRVKVTPHFLISSSLRLLITSSLFLPTHLFTLSSFFYLFLTFYYLLLLASYDRSAQAQLLNLLPAIYYLLFTTYFFSLPTVGQHRLNLLPAIYYLLLLASSSSSLILSLSSLILNSLPSNSLL